MGGNKEIIPIFVKKPTHMTLTATILSLVLVLNGDPLAQARQLMDGTDMEKATGLVLGAIEDAGKSGDKTRQAEALCLLSTIDFRTWRDAQAWEHASEAEALAREVKNDTLLADALINKGKLCIYQNIDGGGSNSRDEEGLALLQEAWEHSGGSAFRQVEIQYNIAQAYIGMNRNNNPIDRKIYRQAGEALAMGDSLAEAAGLSPAETQAYTYKVRYFRQGGNYEGGIEACLQTLEHTSEENYLMQSQIYNHLVALYAMSGDMDKAVDAHQLCMNAQQFYMKQKSDALLQEMETSYHAREMKSRISVLREGIILLSVLLILLAAAIIRIVMLNRRILRQSREIAAAGEVKESLLQLISREFTSKTSFEELQGIASKMSRMDDDGIRAYCREIFAGKEDVASEVGDYFVTLIHDRREKMSDAGLTDREMEVIRYCREGLSNAQIADRMFLSISTIKNHKQRIFAKLGVCSVSELLSVTDKLGII